MLNLLWQFCEIMIMPTIKLVGDNDICASIICCVDLINLWKGNGCFKISLHLSNILSPLRIFLFLWGSVKTVYWSLLVFFLWLSCNVPIKLGILLFMCLLLHYMHKGKLISYFNFQMFKKSWNLILIYKFQSDLRYRLRVGYSMLNVFACQSLAIIFCK